MAIKIEKKKANSDGTASAKSSESILDKELFGTGGFNDKQKSTFYNQLAVLMKSGMSLSYSFQILIEDAKKKEKDIIQKLLSAIVEGKSLFQAMKQEKVFSTYEQYAVMIGEEIADLQGTFQNLADYYKKRIEQRRQIWSALSYPIVILISAILVIFFMIQFVIPTFEEVLVRMGGELPSITQVILSFASFARSYAWILIVVLLLVVVTDKFVLDNNISYKNFKHQVFARLPLIGSVLRIAAISNLFNSLAMLTKSNISLLRSLTIINQMINYPSLNKGLKRSIKMIEGGKTLHSAFKSFDIFDVVTLNYIKVGEESNQLGYYFQLINDKIEQDNAQKIKMLNAVLEPFLILIIGGIVGFILIALYLPIFELSNSIN